MTTVEVSVNPVPIPSPLGREIVVPFQIDPAFGGVAFFRGELDILNQHIATIINTELNERLMLPGYGTNVPADVFQPNGQLLGGFLTSDIQTAVTNLEPAVTIQQVQVVPNPNIPSAVTVNVSYTVNPFNSLNVISVNVGGGVAQVVAP